MQWLGIVRSSFSEQYPATAYSRMTSRSRREFLKTVAGVAGAVVVLPRLAHAAEIVGRARPSDTEGWARVPEILARIKPPVFPKRDFPVTRYGAIADGTTDSSAAIRSAIEACRKAGGGRVVVEGGVFLTGPIHLASKVNLHVAKGATLLFKRDAAVYLPAVLTRYEGTELMNYSPFIYA